VEEKKVEVEDKKEKGKSKNVSLKQPITSATILYDYPEFKESIEPFLDYLKSEMNVEKIIFEPDDSKYVEFVSNPHFENLKIKFANKLH